MTDAPTTALRQLSDSIAHVVEAAGQHVVRVEARRRGHSSGIAWSDDGHVITAHHTVEFDDDIRIGTPDGTVVAATLLGRDPSTDVAVLRASDASLEPPAWIEADRLHVGHLVLSVGRHDAPTQASLGIVSKTGGAWRTDAGGTVDAFVQTDIGVYPGFSGSALVDAEGRVAGMNTSWFRRRSSLTLPPQTLRRVVGSILEHGGIRRGFLGIASHPAALPASAREALDIERGLLVVSVVSGGPADEAGLIVGDLVVALDGEPTPRVDDLLAALTHARIGQSVPVQIVRGGAVQTLSVTIQPRPEDAP